MEQRMKNKNLRNMIRKAITIIIVITSAWLLGQLFALALMKAIFL